MNLKSKEQVDKKAKDFLNNFNSKQDKRHLGWAIFTVPRSNLSLIPLYAWLLYLLNDFHKDIKSDVIDQLQWEYRGEETS